MKPVKYKENIPKQCCGINSYGSGGSKKGDRCKMVVKDFDARLKSCLNYHQDLCYMHCDCEYCSQTYGFCNNRGKRHPSTLDDGKFDYGYRFNPLLSKKRSVPDFILEETNIEKLRTICLVVFEEFPQHWSDIISIAKRKIETKEKTSRVMSKINVLQLEINKLREELE